MRSSALVLCRFHHRAVHEEGFQVVADVAGRFQFLRPDGAPLPAVPPAPQWQGAGAPLAPTGITIGPHTATPEWYGESLNVAAALLEGPAVWRCSAARMSSAPAMETASRTSSPHQHGIALAP